MAQSTNSSCYPQTKGKTPVGPTLKGKKVSKGRTMKGGR